MVEKIGHPDASITYQSGGTKSHFAKAVPDHKDAIQAAFERMQDGTALVLMTMNNYRVDAKGKKTLFNSGRFEVTVNDVGGRWLASNLTSVGLM